MSFDNYGATAQVGEASGPTNPAIGPADCAPSAYWRLVWDSSIPKIGVKPRQRASEKDNLEQFEKFTLAGRGGRNRGPSSGRVLLGENDIRSMAARDVARVLAILPQSPAAGVDLTVRELVWRGRYPHQGILQRATAPDFEAVNWALGAADVESLAERTLGSLSGGERQRAWIALALAQRPKVLLLDEPTSFLDIQHQVEVMHLLRRLNEDGMTVVLVLHDLILAARFADRVLACVKARWRSMARRLRCSNRATWSVSSTSR